jgi:phenylacetate-CoA ligase
MEISPLENWLSSRLDKTEPLNTAQIHEYQLGGLRETLEHATSHGRFYRKHLRGIEPASIRSIEDVAQLPFTEPGILAERPNDFLCVPPRDISRIVTLSTSGTTGHPKRIAFTPEDQERTVDFFHHGMMTLAKPSDRVLIFLPGKTEGSVGDLLMKGLSRFGCEGIPFGPVTDYKHALKRVLEVKATCAVGIPSQLLALSRFRESGLSARIQLKSVLLSTDYVPRAVADSLMQTWGCEVYSHYGMTEMGLGGAVDCGARSGYHMREADLLFEIIDPETKKPARDGEYGEVVFSTLARRGMPLIRYRTGDRSRFLTQPCPCGSILKRMEHISGRISEEVRLYGGASLSITQLDEIVLRNPCVFAYAAEVGVEDGCDCLILTVRSTQHTFDAEQMEFGLCRQHALGDLVKQGHLKLNIREGDVGYFTTGTAKRFIADRRGERGRPA